MKPSISENNGELIPAGDHILTLTKVDEVETDDKWSQTEGAKKVQWVWKFADANGGIYSHWTGTAYGNPKSNLTLLLDRLVPEHKGDKGYFSSEFDTDDLIGQEFRAIIEHRKAESGNTFAFLAFIAPVTASPAATAPQAAAPASPANGKTTPSAAFTKTVKTALKALTEKGYSQKGASELIRDQVAVNDEKSAEDFLKAVHGGVWDLDTFADPFAEPAAA